MCGIAGFTSLREPRSDANDLIARMTAPLISRGPDGEGFYCSAAITLGHRRLSLIDIDGGAQPMAINGGRYRIVYNGELYNYVELRADLERRGCAFFTKSDTEVLLQEYARDGVNALQDFNGMFALAIWDAKEERLLLARDRIGIKPLYYTICDSELIFASELKALLAYPNISRRLNLLSVSKYFTYGYIPSPHTIFEEIYKLEAASYLLFDRRDGLKKKRYWDVPLEDDPISGRTVDEWAEDLLPLLRDSVAIHLRGDVPVGVFLSGGIDSGTIAALAAAKSLEPLHSFSIGFDQPSYDESHHARRLASKIGTIHHEEVMTLDRASEIFPKVMQVLDEPFADASALPTYVLSKLARQYVKVVLGGDGGDELFAGYPSFQAHKILRRLSLLPIGGRDYLGRLVRRLPVSHGYASIEFLMQQFVKGLGLSAEVRFMLWMGFYGNAEKKQLFSADLRHELLRKDAFEDISSYIRQSGLKGDFQRLEYLCAKMYLPDDILTKVDRSGMAHSLEVRFPYLDNDVVNYSCRIQPDYKLKGLQAKYVLKRAVRELLPANVRLRRKTGFMMPVSMWLSKNMRQNVEELCSPAATRATGLFDPDFVERILAEHFEQRRDHRKHIYPLLCFMAWMRNYGSGVFM